MTDDKMGRIRFLVGLFCLACSSVRVLGDISDEYLNFDENCGQAPFNPRSGGRTAPYVINGRSIGYGEWPFVAFVYAHGATCTGVIIRSDQVLTAGHCLEHFFRFKMRRAVDPKFDVRVHVGMVETPRRGKPLDDFEVIHNVSEAQVGAFYPERLKPRADYWDADIARLWLRNPIKFNDYVQPVCVPSREETVEHLLNTRTGFFVGFGFMIDPAFPPCVPVESVKGQMFEVMKGDCQAGNALVKPIETHICVRAVDSSYTGACRGDSGGPFLVLDSNKRWTLVAIGVDGFKCDWPFSAPFVNAFQSLAKIVEVLSDSFKPFDISPEAEAYITRSNVDRTKTLNNAPRYTDRCLFPYPLI